MKAIQPQIAQSDPNDVEANNEDTRNILEDLNGQEELLTTIARSEMKRVGRLVTFIYLCNAVVSAGIVTVPYTFKPLGLGPSFVLLIVVFVLNYICSGFYIQLQKKLNVGSLYDLSSALFDKKVTIFIGVLEMIFTFSCTASYLVIGANQIISWVNLSKLKITGNYVMIAIFLYSLFMPVLLTIPRKIYHLSSISIFISLAILAVSIVITVLSIKYLIDLPEVDSTVKGYNWDKRFFASLGSHVSNSALPIFLLPILRPYNPTHNKRQIVTLFSLIFIFFFLVTPGALSYCAFGDNTNFDILTNFDSTNTLVILTQIAVLIIVTFTYAFITSYLLNVFGYLLYKVPNQENLSNMQRLVVIPIANLTSVVLAIIFRHPVYLLGFGGTLAGCFLCYSFPSICLIRESRKSLLHRSNIIHVLFAVVGSLISIISFIFTLWSAIENLYA